jgi:hypothetical protein
MFLIGNTIDRLKNKYRAMLKLVKSKKSHPQNNMTKANIVFGLSTGY